MKREQRGDVFSHFSEIEDPRIARTKRHDLETILVIAICGIICGAESWVEIEEIGKAKQKYFKQFLELPNGIPSHDTFGRVFAQINPEKFRECFISWVQSVSEISDGEIVAIDGKTLRRSYNKRDSRAAIHMVSAWANQNGLVLAQVKTEEKSNEITAIPKLLELLDIAGCIVTIDAMGCQKEIAEKIIAGGAEYVLALKGNQGLLHEDVKLYLDDAYRTEFREIDHDFYRTVEKDHGRIEIRRYWTVSQIQWLQDKDKWKNLKSIGLVESERTVDGKTSIERRYYLSSLTGNAEEFGKAVRAHWGVENSLHWVLDVSFREDDCRVRKDHAPENMAMLRHIALNLLKKEHSRKRSIKVKRLHAACDNNYLAKVLFQN